MSKKIKLTKEYSEAVATDVDLQAKIAKAMGVSVQSVLSWNNNGSKKWGLQAVQSVLRKHLSLNEAIPLTVEN